MSPWQEFRDLWRGPSTGPVLRAGLLLIWGAVALGLCIVLHLL